MEIWYIAKVNRLSGTDDLQAELDILLTQLEEDMTDACRIEINQRIIKVRSRMVELLQNAENINTTLADAEEEDDTQYTADGDIHGGEDDPRPVAGSPP